MACLLVALNMLMTSYTLSFCCSSEYIWCLIYVTPRVTCLMSSSIQVNPAYLLLVKTTRTSWLAYILVMGTFHDLTAWSIWGFILCQTSAWKIFETDFSVTCRMPRCGKLSSTTQFIYVNVTSDFRHPHWKHCTIIQHNFICPFLRKIYASVNAIISH